MRHDKSRNLLSALFREARLRVYPAKDDDAGTRLATQIGVEGLLAAIVLNLATVFTAMFATRMGATATHIGYLSSLPQFIGMLVLIPGALLAGRLKDSRRPVELALLAAGLVYGLAGLAPWTGSYRIWYLIILVSLANAPMSLYNTTWQNYFSDVIPAHKRNSIYTMRTSMTFIAGIVVVQTTGILLGEAATDAIRIHLYQAFYGLAFLFSLLQLTVLNRSPQMVREKSGHGLSDLKISVRTMVHDKAFMAFAGIAFLFHCGWYMAWPLFFLAQVNYMGANESWLSYISVSSSVLQWLTVRFWGHFIEKHGVRLSLVIGAAGIALNPVMAMTATYFPAGFRLPGMLILNLINACTFSAFQLAILQCLLEVIPVRNRTLNLSIYTTMLLLANTIMQLFGVRFYTLLGSDHQAMSISLGLSGLLRLIGALLFLWRWQTLRHEPDVGQRI